MTPTSSEGVPVASRRTLEIWTAAAVGLVGAIVTAESATHDIGWNETGPATGYFPFRVGLLLIGTAIVRIFQVRLAKAPAVTQPDSTDIRLQPDSTSFVTREELRRSLSVFWPTLALVVAMFPLGCYVPSAVYLAWMMRRHGRYSWAKSAGLAVAVIVVFFLIFELWFGVPLAKGPLEEALGLY